MRNNQIFGCFFCRLGNYKWLKSLSLSKMVCSPAFRVEVKINRVRTRENFMKSLVILIRVPQSFRIDVLFLLVNTVLNLIRSFIPAAEGVSGFW